MSADASSLLKRAYRPGSRLPGDITKDVNQARRSEKIVSIGIDLILGRGGCRRRQEFVDSRRKSRNFAGCTRLGNNPFGRGAIERRGRFLQRRLDLILILFGKGRLNPFDGSSNSRKDTTISLSPFLRLPLPLQCRWMICHS